MGIFNRITDIFKANVNDALDKAEDPEKMLRQMILEMGESINKSTLAVAQAIANEKNLFRKLEKSKQDQGEWQEKAKIALTNGREDLAKAALEKKAIAVKNQSDLEPMHQTAKETAEKLRSQLDALKKKLDEAKMRQSTLVARSQAAKAQKSISQNLSGLGSDSFSKFDKYENKIEQLEAEAEAHSELAGESTSLDDEFKQLEKSSQTDSDLLALKREMGLLDSNENNKSEN